MNERQTRQIVVLNAVKYGIEYMDINIDDKGLIEWIADSLGVSVEITEPSPYDIEHPIPSPWDTLSAPAKTLDEYIGNSTTPEPTPEIKITHREKPLKALQPEDAIKIVSIRSAIGNYRLTIDGPIETAIRKAKRKETLTAVYAEGPSRGRHIEVRADRLKAVVREGGSA